MREMYTAKVPVKAIHIPDIKIRESYLEDPKFESLKASIASDGIKQNIVLRHHKDQHANDIKGEFDLGDGQIGRAHV